MNASLLESIKLGKGIHMFKQECSRVKFSVGKHAFSKECLEKAQELWRVKPGKYDGTIMGVIKVSKKQGVVAIEVAPMKFSIFRYIAKCREEGKALPKGDEVLPIGVASITYYKDKTGERYFLMGIKAKGNIGGGKIEFVPQGFCNPPDSQDMSNYVEDTITRELQEELTAQGQKKQDIGFKQIKNLALVVEDFASDYAFQVACEVEQKALSKCDGISTEEHERIFIVKESELGQVIKDPTAFVNKRLPNMKKKSIVMDEGSKALLYSYMIKQKE